MKTLEVTGTKETENESTSATKDDSKSDKQEAEKERRMNTWANSQEYKRNRDLMKIPESSTDMKKVEMSVEEKLEGTIVFKKNLLFKSGACYHRRLQNSRNCEFEIKFEIEFLQN